MCFYLYITTPNLIELDTKSDIAKQVVKTMQGAELLGGKYLSTYQDWMLSYSK